MNVTLVPVAGEVMSEDEYLDALAARIHLEVARFTAATTEANEARFNVGRALLEARTMFLGDREYGQWVALQGFGFGRHWNRILRSAAEYEDEVRAVLVTQVTSTDTPNFKKVVTQVVAAHGGGRSDKPTLELVRSPLGIEERPSEFSAIVIDPPWRYDNTRTRGAAEDHYDTMSRAELMALELPASASAHLYLWVTNSFFEDGFALMRAWGFTYKTCLTWCKPQIGMGNYFRSTTEHVLFGVRGSLGTLRNDIPTHFIADRTAHSAKPDSFYDLVEESSPGPWLDMFSRRRRMGWHNWGNES